MFDKSVQFLHTIKRRFAGNIDLARIPFVSLIRKKIIRLSRKKIVDNVNGFTMYVGDNDTLALSWHHVFEPATTEFFKRNIKSGQIIVDLGANIGYYTLLFSGLTGPEGHVYAFEPEPVNAGLLRKNLEVNSITNVTVVEKAVDNTETTLRLYINKVNSGNHQIFDMGEQRDTVEIQTTTLDSFFDDKDVKMDWIKMDIEGAEYRALQGMKKVIQKNRNVILVSEIFVPGLTAAGTSVSEYISALKELGFEFEEIDERSNQTISLSSDELIQSFNTPRPVHPNIICRRTRV